MKKISSHKNPAEIIDITGDENGINSVNSYEEADVTHIHLINETNH